MPICVNYSHTFRKAKAAQDNAEFKAQLALLLESLI